MLDNLFNVSAASSQLTLGAIIIDLVLAFILSFIVAVVYKNTHKGLSYSQSFTFTLILIGILVSVVIMVIGNSLAVAFGAFGTFSLIRFRTAIKDTRDVAFILLVVTIGLSVGTRNYLIAILATVFTLAVVYGLNKINFGSIRKFDFILNFSVLTKTFSNDRMRDVFKEYLKYDNLLNVTSREGGKFLDYSFNIKFILNSDMEQFLGKFNSLEGVEDVDLISAKNDIEY
ncbi:MAG: DUF4956 domain-containing protein [Patescibacteria group bacterium]|nr:DUF4956 domain-containing protein [Patescibacteria group bacterium]